MSIYNIKFLNASELAEALFKLGADIRSLPFFDNRREIKALYIPAVDSRGANVIKQELLSRGGDAAVHADVVRFGVSHSDVILFGTKKQLTFLAEKIATMPWWGFPEISTGIIAALKGLSARHLPVKLPNGRKLPLGERTLIMGITNLTEESFFSASRTGADISAAVSRACRQAEEGADILDLGAESTRPGAPRVPEEEELERIASVVRAVRKELPNLPLSVDTTRCSVAKAALGEGADIINDISGLTYEPELAKLAAESNAMLVLMHMRGTPETMRSMCEYDNLLHDVAAFFETGVSKAEELGMDRSRIILDPGIGFAKNYNQNLILLRHLEAFQALGLPLLVGVSRKGFIGTATDSPFAEERLEGTMALSALCAWRGVDILRVHDVRANKKTVMMIDAVKNADYE